MKKKDIQLHLSRQEIEEEINACIGCRECLNVCPALSEPISIETLNKKTLGSALSPSVKRFAQACISCGACVPVCPAGLHRDSMMLWLKVRLLNEALPGKHKKVG